MCRPSSQQTRTTPWWGHEIESYVVSRHYNMVSRPPNNTTTILLKKKGILEDLGHQSIQRARGCERSDILFLSRCAWGVSTYTMVAFIIVYRGLPLVFNNSQLTKHKKFQLLYYHTIILYLSYPYSPYYYTIEKSTLEVNNLNNTGTK